jgi:uncharacterized protein YukE
MGNYWDVYVNYKNLNNCATKLKKISNRMDKLEGFASEFEKSKGMSKKSLDSELETMCLAGNTLKDAVDALAEELQLVSDNFKEVDKELSKLFDDLDKVERRAGDKYEALNKK